MLTQPKHIAIDVHVDGEEISGVASDGTGRPTPFLGGAGLFAALDRRLADGMILDDYIRRIGMPTGGAVRVSLGLVSNRADIERFLVFARDFQDLASVPDDLPPRLAC